MDNPMRQNGKHLAIVLIGSLGSGKSSTGNTIIGDKVFKVSTGTKPVTADIMQGGTKREEHSITIFDTPGLKSVNDLLNIKDQVNARLKTIDPTLAATYVPTIQIGRYTQEERGLLEDIFKNNKDILKKSVIVLTNKDELSDEENENDQAVKSWVDKNPTLTRLIRTYQLKYVAFENKHGLKEEKDLQVKRLISVILGMDEGDGICPTVSESKKTRKSRIYIERETMGKHFGLSGERFFDEQEEIQRHLFD